MTLHIPQGTIIKVLVVDTRLSRQGIGPIMLHIPQIRQPSIHQLFLQREVNIHLPIVVDLAKLPCPLRVNNKIIMNLTTFVRQVKVSSVLLMPIHPVETIMQRAPAQGHRGWSSGRRTLTLNRVAGRRKVTRRDSLMMMESVMNAKRAGSAFPGPVACPPTRISIWEFSPTVVHIRDVGKRSMFHQT